jgi:hypothetical protein
VDDDEENEQCEGNDADSDTSEDFSTKVRDAFQLPTEVVGYHAHLINLIINDSLNPISEEEVKLMERFVKKCRKNSSTRDFVLSSVEKEQQQPYFRSTVSTRWKYAYDFIYNILPLLEKVTDSSRFFLMTDILKWQEVLQKASSAHSNLPKNSVKSGMDSAALFLSPRKINIYKAVCQLLSPICAMIDLVEGDSYPTMSLVQSIAHATETAATNLLQKEKEKANPSETVIKVIEVAIRGVQSRLLYKPLTEYDGYVPIDYIAAA